MVDDDKPERLPNGRFPKGVSGNLHGRPKKTRTRHSNAYNNARAAIAVAEMPVKLTVDGEVTETTAYDAALRRVYQQAMNKGDMRAMKMFLDSVGSATSYLMEHSELVRFLIQRDKEEQDLLRHIFDMFPKPENHGVYNQLDDGSIVPATWADSIRRLKALDTREAEVLAREQAVAAREDRLRD